MDLPTCAKCETFPHGLSGQDCSIGLPFTLFRTRAEM